MEVWKPIKDYGGLYLVSNMGNVKKIAYTTTNKNGKNKTYGERKIMPQNHNTTVFLCGKAKSIKKLVADAFLPNPDDKKTVRNINGDKSDNRLENLEWRKGFPDAYYAKSRKAVICDNITFESITKCADYYGVRSNNMCAWLKGGLPMPKRFEIMGLRYAE